MKPNSGSSGLKVAILAVSLAANLVMVYRGWFAPEPADASAVAAAKGGKTLRKSSLNDLTIRISGEDGSLTWGSLASNDIRSFAAALQAAGVAPELARTIVQARLART